jgi:hypothetical protein
MGNYKESKTQKIWLDWLMLESCIDLRQVEQTWGI